MPKKTICNTAVWGDKRTREALNLQVQGVIIDGAFRDIDENEALNFPIYARASASCRSQQKQLGDYNGTISCGGVIVCPGDIIVADRNGVCVIPLEEAETVLEKLRQLD